MSLDDLQREIAYREHEVHQAFFKSLHEARIVDARSAIQAALFINGGAATAILTFAGNLAVKLPSGKLPSSFAWSLGFFAFGVFSAATAATCAYLTNNQYAEAARAQTLTYEYPYKKPNQEHGSRQKRAIIIHTIASAAVGVALLLFIGGVAAAVTGLLAIGN